MVPNKSDIVSLALAALFGEWYFLCLPVYLVSVWVLFDKPGLLSTMISLPDIGTLSFTPSFTIAILAIDHYTIWTTCVFIKLIKWLFDQARMALLHWLALKNACAKPGWVIERAMALGLIFGSRL